MISFLGASGLFTRLGHIFNTLADINIFQGTTLRNDFTAIEAQYTGADLVMIDCVESLLFTNQTQAGVSVTDLVTFADNTIIQMVQNDNPQLSKDLLTCLTEVIRQMRTAVATVQACTVAVASTTAASANIGNGQVITSVRRFDGLFQENLFAENIMCLVTADQNDDSANAGSETFLVTGGEPPTDNFDWNYGSRGSGANTTLSAIDPTADDTGGNVLTNSGFETYTVANIPDGWDILVGSAGTTVKKSIAQFYTGAASLNFVGNASELTSVAQTFGVGTLGTLTALTQYAVGLWIRTSNITLETGVVEVSLVDSSNAVVNDYSGNANLFTNALSAITVNTWTPISGVFRTPQNLPTTLKLRVRLSVAALAATNVYVDNLGMGIMTEAYSGGPAIGVVSGATDWHDGDNVVVAVTNNRGGASNLKTFQTMFDRFYDMKGLGLLLPSSGSPSISDALIA